MKKFKVAVAGATGAVGIEMIKMLESRDFPVGELIPLASSRSEGKKVVFRGKEVEVGNLDKFTSNLASFSPSLALFSAGGDVSKRYAPQFAAAGCFVVDNSSAFRMDPGVPLVVPEVNADELAPDKKIIANPNCSTIQMVVALAPLHRAAKIRRIIVSTYQSVSGAGGRAIEELLSQNRALAEGKPVPPPSKFAYRIALNLIPQIDVFLDNGYTKEEMKMVDETKKILRDDEIRISATCVRVPVIRSHSENVWVEFEKDITPAEAREILGKAPGIEVQDEPSSQKYPMPLTAENKQVTYVGRIRRDISAKKSLTFWVVSDNLLKGAALNAVEISEALLNRNILV